MTGEAGPDQRLVHHHIGGRAGDAPFAMSPQLGADVLRVLYEADRDAVEQIRKASADAGVPTVVRPEFVGLPGRSVRFAVNYCPYTSSAFPLASRYRPYLVSEGGRDYVLGDVGAPLREVELTSRGLDEIVLGESGGPPPPDMLSMDTQGGERDILAGAARLLESSVLAVATEVQFHEVYAGAACFGEICEILGRYGFLFLEFDHLARFAPRRVPLGLRGRGVTLFGDATFLKDPNVIAATLGDRAGPALHKLAFLALTRAQLEFAQTCLDLAPTGPAAESPRPAYLRLVEEFGALCASAPRCLPWLFTEAYTPETSEARFRLLGGEAGARIATETTLQARQELEKLLAGAAALGEAAQATALIDLFNRYGLGHVAKTVHGIQRDAVDAYVNGVMRTAGVERIDVQPT